MKKPTIVLFSAFGSLLTLAILCRETKEEYLMDRFNLSLPTGVQNVKFYNPIFSATSSLSFDLDNESIESLKEESARAG